MDKATASALIDAAWAAIRALSEAAEANELPADLYQGLPSVQACNSLYCDLLPLIYIGAYPEAADGCENYEVCGKVVQHIEIPEQDEEAD